MLTRTLALPMLTIALTSPVAAFDIKSSPMPGDVPLLASDGEIAINRADGRLYYKAEGGAIAGGLLADLDASGYLKYRNGMTLGRYQNGKFVSQPDSLDIKGSGSTGLVSDTSIQHTDIGAIAIKLRDKLSHVIELEDFGGKADAPMPGRDPAGPMTDNLPAWNKAIAAMKSLRNARSCAPLRIRAGSYYFSGPIIADFSNATSLYGCGGSISGTGAQSTFLVFPNGVNGLNYNSNLTYSGATLGGFQIVKGGYSGNQYGDLTGAGLIISNSPHIRVHDIKGIQWQFGMKLYDMQEMVLENIDMQYNNYGGRIEVSTISRPNAIIFKNVHFGGNFTNCLTVLNPAALLFLGGGCEATHPDGKTVTAADQYGVKLVFTNSVLEGTTGATFMGWYSESNVGPHIWYANAQGPSGLTLIGNTFQLHSQDNIKASPKIKFETGGSFAQHLNLIGNGFRGYKDYIASTSTPYVQVTNPTKVKVTDLGNNYVDPTEAPKFATVVQGLMSPPLAASASYGSDAAAAAGGVPVGGFYRNGSALQIRVD